MWNIKIFLIIFIIFFNEFLIYRLQKIKWKKFHCKNYKKCMRILFVADPQILGNVNEKFYARLDNDRHLAQNYGVALKFVQPNVIIFLGDLMDEGSIASDRQYLDYYERFIKLFPIPENVNAIYVPGDNDIGGEGGEKIDTRRFNAIFCNETFWKFKNSIEIFHVNRITKKNPKIPKHQSNTTRIVISHYELMNGYDKDLKNYLKEIGAKIIFSAHNHKSTFNTGEIGSYKKHDLSKFVSINFSDYFDMIEIQIPTVSYRMGTMKIGFGQAVIEEEILQYAPLFIISRFYQFIIYLVVLKVFAISTCCIRFISYLKRKRNDRKYQKLINIE